MESKKYNCKIDVVYWADPKLINKEGMEISLVEKKDGLEMRIIPGAGRIPLTKTNL